MTSPEQGDSKVLRVGKDPVVTWGEEEGRPRFHIFAPGWVVEFDRRRVVELGEGAWIAATVVKYDDEFAAAGEEPDVEHGFVLIGGLTIADMREIRASRREGWTPLGRVRYVLARLLGVLRGRPPMQRLSS